MVWPPTKLTRKVEEALTTELETMNTESVPESRRILASTIVEHVKAKLTQIAELDEAIAKMIQGEEELEMEICDADTYQSNIEQQILLLVEVVKKASQLPSKSTTFHPPPSVNDQPCLKPSATPDTEVTTVILPETEVVKKPVHFK